MEYAKIESDYFCGTMGPPRLTFAQHVCLYHRSKGKEIVS